MWLKLVYQLSLVQFQLGTFVADPSFCPVSYWSLK